MTPFPTSQTQKTSKTLHVDAHHLDNDPKDIRLMSHRSDPIYVGYVRDTLHTAETLYRCNTMIAFEAFRNVRDALRRDAVAAEDFLGDFRNNLAIRQVANRNDDRRIPLWKYKIGLGNNAPIYLSCKSVSSVVYSYK